MEVVIFLLQVVQTGVGLVQRGVHGSVLCFPKPSSSPSAPASTHMPKFPLGPDISGSGSAGAMHATLEISVRHAESRYWPEGGSS
jgi:hypothetical protein